MRSPIVWPLRCTVLMLLMAGCAILAPHPSAHTRSTAVTWTKDIAPIVQRRCAACHSEGGVSAVRLSTYEEAKIQARAMREEVLEGRMPPWPAARGLGDFSNDRSLSPIELELLTAWADGNTPLGTAPEPHPVSSVSSRAPDLVLEVPKSRIGRARTGRFEIAAGNRTSRWISGWSFRAGDPALVDRAVVSLVGGGSIGSWVPGDAPTQFPAGVAERLPAGATLSVEFYYRKSSATEMPAGALQLFFRDAAARRLRHRALDCDLSSVGENIEALAVTPLAAAAGDSLEIVARRPDRSIEPLIVIPQFDPGYPVTYRFRSPIALPKGTTVRVRGSSPGCSAELEFIARRPRRAAAP
jgi:hypothetical protein